MRVCSCDALAGSEEGFCSTWGLTGGWRPPLAPSEPGPGGGRSPAKPAKVPALSPLGSLDKKLNHRDACLSPHYRLLLSLEAG